MKFSVSSYSYSKLTSSGKYTEKGLIALAKEMGFDYFTTTLSVSPHKDPVRLNEIGEKCGEKYGIKHLPADFKKKNGYLRSLQLSREYDLYRQDYCGCLYSKQAT